MVRTLTAVALLVVVLTGGLVLGAINGFVEDTAFDWDDDDQ